MAIFNSYVKLPEGECTSPCFLVSTLNNFPTIRVPKGTKYPGECNVTFATLEGEELWGTCLDVPSMGFYIVLLEFHGISWHLMDMCWDTLRIAMHSYKVRPALRHRQKLAVTTWLSRRSTWVSLDL